MNEQSSGSKAAADVAALLRARNPLLWIVTREEARVERLLIESASVARYEPRFWDCATGISTFDGKPVDGGVDKTDPGVVLGAIRDDRKRHLWVLRDIPRFFNDPFILRALRSLARNLPLAPRDEARAVIVLSPSNEVPPELAGHAIVIEWPLPDRQEIGEILDASIEGLPDELQKSAAPNGTREQAIDAAVGLTAEEAQSCYAKSLVSTKKIDPQAVAQEKKRVIAREKVLEWFDPLPGGLDAVGGLENLKGWLVARKSAFSAKARAYGLPAPKGTLLVGVPGCGKSLTAKAIATAWQMPLLKLDLGALKGKYVGESEGNIRKALKVAETVAPCVLWLDEIEKALAGATQGAADGGVSADALGVVLSWMQERAGNVFVVATSNDVSALPPELLRKGRFDELFFVDLPNDSEREQILSVALKSHGRGEIPGQHDVARSCFGFTGAEIAAIVPDALFESFADGERELTSEDLLAAVKRTVPLSKTAAEKIASLRQWADGRARPASRQQEEKQSKARALEV